MGWFRAGSVVATLAIKPRRRIPFFMVRNRKGIDGIDNGVWEKCVDGQETKRIDVA